jgi:adenylate cyclase
MSVRAFLPRCLFDNHRTRQDDPPTGGVERKLTAILCADVYGYSRLMGGDEEATLLTLTAHRKIIDSLIERHHGRFVNSAGDSVLAEFASVVEAVNCAVDIQTALKAENAKLPPERRMEFRIGVNLGDVMVEGDQIYGDGINIAARLESLADPGGICISGKVHEEIRSKLPLGYEDNGEQTVKNIARPLRVWRVRNKQGTRFKDLGERRLKNVSRPIRVYQITDTTLVAQPAEPTGRRRQTALIAGAGAVILAGLALVFVRLRSTAAVSPAQSAAKRTISSIAVLPFDNYSGDPNQEYFSDGMTDELTTDLATLSTLRVISRGSVMQYKGAHRPPTPEIAKALNVDAVVEGSVMRVGDKVRITVQLIDAPDDKNLWAKSFERDSRDVLALQDELASAIASEINAQLIAQFEEAVRLDPNFALPNEVSAPGGIGF